MNSIFPKLPPRLTSRIFPHPFHKSNRPLSCQCLQPHWPPPQSPEQEASHVGHDDYTTAPRKYFLDDDLRQHLCSQRGHQEIRFIPEASRHFGRGPSGENTERPDLRCRVCRHQLGGQSFMEGQDSGFRAAVVDEVGCRRCSCQRGDADHSTVLGRDHRRKKFSNQPEMGQYIQIEGVRNRGFRGG